MVSDNGDADTSSTPEPTLPAPKPLQSQVEEEQRTTSSTGNGTPFNTEKIDMRLTSTLEVADSKNESLLGKSKDFRSSFGRHVSALAPLEANGNIPKGHLDRFVSGFFAPISPRSLSRFLTTAAYLLSIALIVFYWVSPHGYIANLFQELRIQVALLLPLMIIFTYSMKHRVVFAALSAVVAAPILTHSFGSTMSTMAEPGDTQMSVTSHNVWYYNQQPGNLSEALTESDSDVLVLFEVTQPLKEQLALADVYPHELCETRPDSFGLCIYSKKKWVEATIEYRNEAKQPTLKALFPAANPDQQNLELFAIHPKPPISAEAFTERNLYLDQVAEDLPDPTTPAIVIGDMNLSPWTRTYGQFLDDTKLLDAGRGRGFKSTWNRGPDIALTALNIDHGFVNQSIHVDSFTVGARSGSDHHMITLEFSY